MIQVKNLYCKLGNKSILKNLNFELQEGGFYALMGENGSGKTTLLRCLSKGIDVEKNTILLNNKDLQKYSAKELAQIISVVPQRQYVEFDFTAFDMVMMGRNPHQKKLQADSEDDLSIVKDSMQKTHTWHLKDMNINKLSGGEYQRVIIARSMAQQSPVMLLDEPLSNLDIAHQYEILELLTTLNKTEQKTILLILHDLNMALRYCSQIMLLKEGEIVFCGKTSDALLNSQLIESVFNIKAHLHQIESKNVILFG